MVLLLQALVVEWYLGRPLLHATRPSQLSSRAATSSIITVVVGTTMFDQMIRPYHLVTIFLIVFSVTLNNNLVAPASSGKLAEVVVPKKRKPVEQIQEHHVASRNFQVRE